MGAKCSSSCSSEIPERGVASNMGSRHNNRGRDQYKAVQKCKQNKQQQQKEKVENQTVHNDSFSGNRTQPSMSTSYSNTIVGSSSSIDSNTKHALDDIIDTSTTVLITPRTAINDNDTNTDANTDANTDTNTNRFPPMAGVGAVPPALPPMTTSATMDNTPHAYYGPPRGSLSMPHSNQIPLQYRNLGPHGSRSSSARSSLNSNNNNKKVTKRRNSEHRHNYRHGDKKSWTEASTLRLDTEMSDQISMLARKISLEDKGDLTEEQEKELIDIRLTLGNNNDNDDEDDDDEDDSEEKNELQMLDTLRQDPTSGVLSTDSIVSGLSYDSNSNNTPVRPVVSGSVLRSSSLDSTQSNESNDLDSDEDSDSGDGSSFLSPLSKGIALEQVKECVNESESDHDNDSDSNGEGELQDIDGKHSVQDKVELAAAGGGGGDDGSGAEVDSPGVGEQINL